MAAEDTDITINDNPRIRPTVRADPSGEPPFTIEKTAIVSRVAIPRRGDRCTVFYRPRDRENRNGVSFDFAGPALGQVRDKGLLTQEEFEEQKRRLLGEI